ncbi:PKD domain containing protein, partial [Acetivibrio thermocellus YS]
NYSEDGVEFNQPLNANTFIDNGCVIKFPGEQKRGWKLSADEEYTGNLYIGAGVLDLNGFNLTVNGDLIQSGGVIDLNGGCLTVKGDYRIQTEIPSSNGQTINMYSNGYLKMTKPTDYLKVEGDFLIYSQHSHANYLTDGTLEVKGNFTQKRYNSYDNFKATGNHRVVLSGEELQIVTFESSSGSGSCINILEITNSSDKGVRFTSKVFVNGALKYTSTPVAGGEYLCIGTNTAINWDTWDYDLCIDGNRTLVRDINIKGSLFLNDGILNLNGYKLSVGGNLIQSGGTMYINKGQLLVEGSYRIQSRNYQADGTFEYGRCYGYLRMNNEEDYVRVGRDFVTQSYYSHASYLTAGILEVKGDFTQKGDSSSSSNFRATGTHKTILSGESLQRVTFTHPGDSGFNELIITKPLESGYIFSHSPLWNIIKEEVIDSEPPSVPTNLQVVSKTLTTVTLQWDTSEDNVNVEGYEIYRNGIRVGNSRTLSYIDHGLVPNTEYTYTVRAYDAVRNLSDFSEAVKVRTDVDNEPPTAPKNLGISSRTDTSVTLTWSASTDNAAVTGYKIYRNGVNIADTVNTRYTDYDLEPGTYSYYVKAFDASGNVSDVSNTVVFDNQPPTAPENVFVTSVTTTSVSLEWTESTDNIGVAGYRIYRNGVHIRNVTGNKFTDTGLTPDETYIYIIRAYDNAGNVSPESESITVVAASDAEPPSAPSNLRVVSKSESSITLTWDKSTDNVKVAGYKIYRDGIEVGTSDTNLFIDKKVTKDHSYTYSVKAYDMAGNYSAESQPLTVTLVLPAAPVQIEAVAGEGKIDVVWSKVDDSDIVKYRLYRSENGHDYELIYESALMSYTDSNVLYGNTYIYMVKAVDIYGNESSGSTSQAVEPLPDITPPVIVGMVPADGSRVNGETRLSVLASDNVKIKAMEFLFTSNKEEGTWESIGATTTGSVNWNTKELVDGLYYVKVVVSDTSDNISEFISEYTVDNTPPAAPVLKASSSELRVLLEWELSVKAEDFDHFRVYRSTEGGAEDTFELIENTMDFSYADTAAPLDVDSFYKVTAVDMLGNESEASNIVSARPGSDTTPPQIIKFTPEDGSSIRSGVTLTAYAKDNLEVNMYSFQFRPLDENGNPIGDGEWTPIADVQNPGKNEVQVKWDTLATGPEGEELYPDGYYQVRVMVSDAAGNFSQKIHTYLLANDPPSPPEHLYVQAGEWQLVVSWSPVLRPDFRYYVLYRKEGREGTWEKIVSNTTSNVYIDTMRDPQKEYFYAVSVVNDLGRESERTYDYSKDENISEGIDIRALHQTSSPLIFSMKPAELSRTNSTLEIETVISDAVGVSVIYEYAYLGDSPSSGVDGDETWHLIGEDSSPVPGKVYDLEDFLERILKGEELPEIGVGENYFVSNCIWNVSSLASGTYAVRATAVNKGNKEASLIKKYIVDREAPQTPSGLKVVDPKVGGELQLSWERSKSDDVDHYVVYRATESGGNFKAVTRTKSLVYTDKGLEDGKIYYYVVTAVDSAGNESGKSNQVSSVPSALSDLTIVSVEANPQVPAYDRQAEIICTVKNLGYAKAEGRVDFYIENQGEWSKIGSSTIEVKSMDNSKASITWIPDSHLDNIVTVMAVVNTMDGSEDINEDNNSLTAELRLNIPPEAHIQTKEWIYSGDVFTLDGSLSKDSDGRIVSYKWDLENGVEKKGAHITHTYQIPGIYNITLTVTDNNGANSTATVSIHVYDNRPDLIVSDIQWDPEEPQEGDIVNIVAKIANVGKGPNRQGFLTGFYIDNKYMGYVRVDESINPGESIDVPFTWKAEPGVHVLKVAANDILDNLKEISVENNTKTVALTTQQVNFPDVVADEITWTCGDNVKIDSESPFGYKVKISNIGTKKAEKFFVSLYVDGEWTAKQHINVLEAGETRELTFIVKPKSGKHEVTVKVDDPVPVLVELNNDNNVISVTTPEFNVTYPKIELSPVTWLPEESILTEGTSLTFETKVKNTGTVDIRNKFDIDFVVDNVKIKTVTVEGLNAGEEKTVWARWMAQPGTHNVSVVADASGTVTDSVYGVQVSAVVPYIKILYPDLNISDVQWSPLSVKYGQPVTFIARVSNQSVTSIFKEFSVGLYINGKLSDEKKIKGLRGHSTAVVDLTCTPEVLGNADVKIVVDPYNQIKQEPASDKVIRIWEGNLNIADALVAEIRPSPQEQNDEFMAHIYCTTDNFIPLEVKAKRASDLSKLIGPNEGIRAYYILRKDDTTLLNGEIGFDYASSVFKGQIPLMRLASGNYILTIEVGDGIESITSTSNIMIVEETVATVETDKKEYQHGETVHISGYFRYRDGTPLANQRIVLDLCLEPRLPDPIISYINGKMIIKAWHAETLRFVNTDENGYFEYDFLPTTLGAGKWRVNAFAYEKGVGSAAVSEFTVWGMTASPSTLSVVSSKNSSFSAFVSVNNMAKAEQSLTGVSAVLVDLTPDSGVRAVMDTSTLSSVIGPNGKSGVMLNFNAPLNAADTAEYQVIFSSSEGAVATANVKVYLRPAIPNPVTDPKGVKVGVNPGKIVTKRVTVTNKGLGEMENIKLLPPANLPWVKAINLEKTFLAPGESTSFDIVVNPPEGTPLGQYQDSITVTDGKYKALVTVGVEISSANIGSLTFLVKDDMGQRVENAEVTIVGKEPYVQIIKGQKTTYYQNFYGRTDSNGIVTFEDVPIGEYTYTIRAKAKKHVTGTANVMPMHESAMVEVTMETEPVQIEWSVVPTTIEDKYDIQLDLTFETNIPSPKFGFVPPWLTVPKQVTEPIIIEATVINTGLVAVTDVTASVLRENNEDTGISIVGGGYIGEIPAHGSVRVSIMVKPGYYNLKYGINDKTGLPYNAIVLRGKYVSFDSDTGLPVFHANQVTGMLPLQNPGDKNAVLKVKTGEGEEKMEVNLANEQLVEFDYFVPIEDDNIDYGDGAAGNTQIASFKLSQTATLERQAFDATLKIENGYIKDALQNLEVRILITDTEGNNITGQNFIILTSLNGISALDGSASLSAGEQVTATWQLIPGDGLGGEDPEGQTYLARAIVSYYVNGRYVETETEPQEITIKPQPKIKLTYYVPGKILSGQPFRLGVVAENVGYGTAKNLVIESGQLEIKTNQSGLLTQFEIVDTSFGSKTGNSFRLNLGDIEPQGRVSGYWLVRWIMYEEEERAKPFEGEFRDFKATLTHRDYNGVQLNPLIVSVDTEIIGKDNIYGDKSGTDGVLSLIDVGNTGFPNYLINLDTGMKFPIYVPETLNVERQPDDENKILKFTVPAIEENPDAPEMPKYQVLMLKDPMPDTPISSVTREMDAEGTEPVALGKNNVWKNNGNIYIVDEIPVLSIKPRDYNNEQSRYYHPSTYTIDFTSGAVISAVEYARIYYDVNPKTLEVEEKYAYYDIGVYPNEGQMTRVRAAVYNEGRSVEGGIVEFFATKLDFKGEVEEEIKIGEGRFNNLEPMNSTYVYVNWLPEKGGEYVLKAKIAGNGSPQAVSEAKARVNFKPFADAGADFSVDVLKPTKFDASRSFDKDGYIQSFIWDFGDGESAFGVAPVHTYLNSGTYKVKLTVIDDNYVEATTEMQVTVNETRADLRVTDISLSNDNPKEGERVKVTATIFNGGYAATDNSFLVGFYVNNMFKDYVRVTESINPGESKDVTFEWLNIAGNHMITVVANDMGRLVDEADFDNNQLSRAVNTENAFFPNLKVTEFTWNGPEDGILDWNQEITLSAVIENDGMANAEKFNVSFMVNDKLIEAKVIDGLPYSKGRNTVKVSAVWKVNTEGVQTFKVVADGPIPHIVEIERGDNEAVMQSPNIRLRYPDLTVQNVSIEPADMVIQPGQPLVIDVSVANVGYADANKPFNVSVFADDVYIGTKEINEILKGTTSSAIFVWNRPVGGTKSIKVYVDENNSIREYNEGNNRFVYDLNIPLNVKLPKLSVEEIKTIPDDGTSKFGDTVVTQVRLKNIGDAAINKPFTTSLYVNNVLAGSFSTSTVLEPGAVVTGEIEWTADYLPTAPYYELVVFADAYSDIPMADREAAIKTAYYKVNDELRLELEETREVYTVKEDIEYFLKVTSTDELWRPLGTEDGISAELKLFKGQSAENDNPAGSPVFASLMEYDKVKGLFKTRIDRGLEAGDYIVQIIVNDGVERRNTVYSAFKLVPDYTVTVESEKQTYSVNEAIRINGKVTMGDGVTPIENAEVTIIIVGEEEWRTDTKTDKNGCYTGEFDLPEGFGGSYSLRAEAKVNGAVKSSSTKVFYVEGLYVSLPQKLEITAGYEQSAKITLVNVGTIPLTAINIDKIWEESSDYVIAEFEGHLPETVEPGESVDLNMVVKAGEEAVTGIYTLKLVVGCNEGYTYTSGIEVRVVEAKPEYYIEITGLKPSVTKSNVSSGAIEGAVRPGEMITQIISVYNVGTGSIKDLHVTPPEKLPWITLTTSGTDLILPMGKGLSIRDENARAIIAVNILPNEYVRPGIYEDVITLTSNAGTKTIPVKINVGAAHVGTITLEAVDSNYAPVEDAKITLIGPHTSDWEQPMDEKVYQGVVTGKGVFRFENIPAGIYTLKVSASGYESVEESIIVPAVINEIPQKVVIEKKKINLGWSSSSIMNSIRKGLRSTEEIVLEQQINTVPGKPQLVANFPGDEVTVRDTDLINGSVGGEFRIKNYSSEREIYWVEAEINYDNLDLPAYSVNLSYGKITNNSVALGDFGPGESKNIRWSFDLSCLYYEADVIPTDTPDQYKVIAPKEVTPENFDAWLKGLSWLYYGNRVVKKISWDEETNTYIIGVPQNEDGSYTMPKGYIQRLFGKSYALDLTISISGTGLGLNGEEIEVSLNLPVRITYYPSDIIANPIPENDLKKFGVKEVSGNDEDGEVRKYSRNFLKERCNMDVSDLPEPAGNAAASFGFSQDVAMVDEAFNAEFVFYNPYEDKKIDDVRFKIIITDKPLDTMGNIADGGRSVTERFIIEADDIGNAMSNGEWMIVDKIGPDSNYSFRYNIKSRAGLGDISGDYYAYVVYYYVLDGKVYQGYIGPKKFTIEPPPKLYISYKLNKIGESHYEIEAIVTNTGDGTARNVTVGLPVIPGAGKIEVIRIVSGDGFFQRDLSVLNIGNVYAGETKSGTFEIVANGLEDWMNLPSLAVHSTQVNDNIVVSPMAIQKVWRGDFELLIQEVERLEYNLQNLMNKTVHDLATVVVDVAEYVGEADEAERFSRAIDGMSAVISYVDFMVNLFDIFKVAFGLDNEIPLNPFPSKLYYTPEEQKLLQQIGAQLREIKKEIEEAKRKLEAGDMTEEEKLALEEKIKDLEAEYEYNVERMQAIIGWPTSAGEIILERFGLNGVVELISWTDDLMQYKVNQEETRKMMGELVRFAYDLLAEGISREEAIDKVIERINAKAFRLVDRKKVEDFYVNSPELDDGQMDAMIQELIDKAEQLTIKELKSRVALELMEAKQLLDSYSYGRTNVPSYYPLDPLLEYLKGLNKELEGMWSIGDGEMAQGVGMYKNVWVYHPYYGDLIPYQVKIGEYKEPLVESLKIQSRGYSNLAARWEVNGIKAMLPAYDYFNLVIGFLPLSPYFGLMSSLFIDSMLMASLKSQISLREIDLRYEQRKIFEDMISNTISTTAMAGTTLSRELSVANSVNGMFVAIDEWRKIDPPLPVEVMSMVVPDIAVGPANEVGVGKAVLKIKNLYTGALTISPSLEVYSSAGLVAVPDTNSVTVAPGETVTVEIPFSIPRSTMMDAGGYVAVAFFGVAEPGTMSIGDVKGPYTSYFFVGTQEQIEARRAYYKPSQPLGRDIEPGEQDEMFIESDGNLGEIRLFMAAKWGTTLEFAVYDPEGNVAGNVEGVVRNEIQGAEINGLINSVDYIRIVNPVKGKYRVVVKAPDGEESESYSLNMLELPDLGAVPDVSYPYVVVSTTKEVGFEFDVFESSMRYDIDKVSFSVGELRNEDGYVVPSGIFKFTGYDGKTLVETVEAGMGVTAIATAELPEDTPDGTYVGLFTVTVEGRNLNPALVRQTGTMSVSDSVYGWSEGFVSDIEGLEGYTYNVPIIIVLNTSIPQTPVLYPVSEPTEEAPYTVKIEGEAESESGIMIWVDGTLQGMLKANSEGLFSTSLGLNAGSHEIYVTAFNKYGTQSEPSEEYTVKIKGRYTQTPTAPTDLEAVYVGKERIELKWTPSTGSLRGYKVYRDGKQIGEVTTPAFIDTDITEGEIYIYAVTAVDIFGEESGQSNLVTVTVEKKEKPVLIVPTDIVAEATGQRTKVDIGTAYVENMPDADVSNNAPEDYPLGVTTVVWTVKDKEGNVIVSGEQKVTVVDTTPPELMVPMDTTVETTEEKVSVVLGEASAYDLVDGVVDVTNDAPDLYPVGTTIVTFTAVDSQGNKVSKTVKVTVIKVEKPTEPPVEPPVNPPIEPPVNPPVNPPADNPSAGPVISEPVEVIPGPGGDKESDDEEKVQMDKEGNITVVPQTEGNAAISTVAARDLENAFEKFGSDPAGRKKVSIEIKKADGVEVYEQKLPSSIFTDTESGRKIEIKTPVATVEIPLDMFEEKDIEKAESISVRVSKVEASDLSMEQKAQIGDRPVIQLEVLVDGRLINWRSNKTSIKISVDYTPKGDELKKTDRIFVWYVGDSGKLSAIPMAVYKEDAGKVIFSVQQSGKYAVAYRYKSFDDLKGYDWAKEQIEILASKGIINGTSSTKYSPGLNITRADAVILIVKALGLEAEFTENFDDVSADKYYYEAVGIARSFGIVTGVGNNKFNPETPITRQELMVIVNRALKVVGINLDTGDVSELEAFKDFSEISPYAVESVAALVKAGIIKGDDNKLIAPLRNITRAETAVIIYKLFEKMTELLQ